MTNESPIPEDTINRRGNFRIDNVLPISIRKLAGQPRPTAHLIPIAVSGSGSLTQDGSFISAFNEPNPILSLTLIELRSKLDLLLNAAHPEGDRRPNDNGPALLTLGQLVAQLNRQADQLLTLNRQARADERVQIEAVNLSASGIKLLTDEVLEANDQVEVRIFINLREPFWVVAGGTVVRAQLLSSGRREVAIDFTGISETVSDELSRYALLCQKQQIIARRGAPS